MSSVYGCTEHVFKTTQSIETFLAPGHDTMRKRDQFV